MRWNKRSRQTTTQGFLFGRVDGCEVSLHEEIGEKINPLIDSKCLVLGEENDSSSVTGCGI